MTAIVAAVSGHTVSLHGNWNAEEEKEGKKLRIVYALPTILSLMFDSGWHLTSQGLVLTHCTLHSKRFWKWFTIITYIYEAPQLFPKRIDGDHLSGVQGIHRVMAAGDCWVVLTASSLFPDCPAARSRETYHVMTNSDQND